MNSVSPLQKITNYDDLQAERRRLEELIKGQKILIRHDLDEIKNDVESKFLEIKHEAEEKFKPVVDASRFVKKLTVPETRNQTLLSIGTNVTLDLLIRKFFAKSSILVQILLPTLVKNYSTHVVFNMMKKIAARRQNGHAKSQIVDISKLN